MWYETYVTKYFYHISISRYYFPMATVNNIKQTPVTKVLLKRVELQVMNNR